VSFKHIIVSITHKLNNEIATEFFRRQVSEARNKKMNVLVGAILLVGGRAPDSVSRL